MSTRTADMKLFIAEKPSLARAIAEGLGIEQRENTCIRCRDGSVVTWCFGHLLEQAEPDEYLPVNVPRGRNGKKIWRLEDLPIFPTEWVMQKRGDARVKAQLTAIGKLIRSASVIVHSGDPDREGQLLVDEVLEYFGCRKPVERFWASAIDPESIRKALGDLKPNKQFSGMRDAARGRSRADWLLGMNLSRFYTLREQAKGSRELIVVGRVQTPTLTLVAQRDYAVRNFKPVPYLTITAACRADGKTFRAKWTPGEAAEGSPGFDQEGRLIDLERGRALVRKLSSVREARVVTCEVKMKRQMQPRCYSLAGIQQAASEKFGFTAEHTLKVCQGLYEQHRCASYPRTDCEYLPESQFAQAPGVITAIAKTMKAVPGVQDICSKVDTSLKSPVWDDGKVTAHHGIVPTKLPVNWSSLSEDEQRIYSLIAFRYLAQFFPPYEFEATRIVLDLLGEPFVSTGKVPRKEGWKVLYRKEEREAERTGTETGAESRSSDVSAASSEALEANEAQNRDQDQNQELPKLSPGDRVPVAAVEGREEKTKPPAYFTEGTLIAAMESIHRAFEDPRIRSRLKEADGIGTPATRAGIISELKRREFLVTEGRKLHCSEAGREMLTKVTPRIRSAVLTAHFEEMLKEVEAGKLSLETFEDQIRAFVRSEIEAH